MPYSPLPRPTIRVNRRLPISLSLFAILAGVALAAVALNYFRGESTLSRDTELSRDKGSITGESPKSPGRISQPANESLRKTIAHLDAQATNLEDQKDVKCWTSFKLLETFIAGCQLAPETTHLKTEVVVNYLDQVWARADRAAGDRPSIDAETFQRTIQQSVPWETDRLLEYRVKFPERVVRIRHQDVENYLSTVEPIRLLRSLAGRIAEDEPQRKGLSADAIREASELAALLSTLVLGEANAVAREHQHQQVKDADVLEADRRIAKGLHFSTLDLSRREPPPAKSLADVGAAAARNGGTMLSLVRQKIQSLETFNTTYSRENLDQTFVADLADHEREWARLPVDPQASAAYKESDLVDLAEFLYENCARLHPGSNPLTGAQMLSTIQRIYPSVTHFEHGTIHLYPDQPIIQGLKVEEYEADAFRDSAWHWRALEGMLQRTSSRQPKLPSLDLYALEELSEFLSVFSVAYVKLAGQIARNDARGDNQAVDSKAFKSAHRLFVLATKNHLEASPEVSTETDAPGQAAEAEAQYQRDPAGQTKARESLARAYIEAPFSDVTSAAGIDFHHESSPLVEQHRFATQGQRPQDIAGYVTRAKYVRAQGYQSSIPNHSLGIEGGGAAVGDIDGDGLLDIYLVSGHADRLYRNRGDFRFEDVTAQANLGGEADGEGADGEGRGAYFIDYDNDGDQDLFVTQVYAPNRLFQNQGKGTFIDVTREAGLPLRTDLVSHSAVWFDFDNDGFLDVYIGNYGDWLGDELPLVQADSRNGQANLLYRNNGHGGFEDLTSRAGAGDVGWAQAVSHFDVNRDGWQDLYVANDFGQDLILVNDRGQRFTKNVVGEGRYLHGMSVGFTDVNGDGAEDVYVSNIATFSFASKYIKPDAATRIAVSQRTTESMRMIENNLFMVSGASGYREQHHAYFDRSRTGSGWAWDADFFDFDNDGEEDLYIVNGREPHLSYAYERNVLYKQVEGHFYDVSAASGADFKSNARGAVHADLDRDGDLDLVVNNYKDHAVVLRNNLQRHNWIRIRLQGSASNRDAVGARVTIHTANGKQTRTVRGGSGFLSKEDNALHFGLKESRSVERIEVTWPSGRQQSIADLPANQEHTIVEGK